MARSTGFPVSPASAIAVPPRGTALLEDARLAVAWRLVLVAAAIAGIAQLDIGSSLIYFTVQSNAFLVIVFGYDVVASFLRRSPLPLAVKGAATLYILITGLVYNLILAPTLHPAPGAVSVPIIGGTPSNDLLHLMTPAMTLLDWLLFEAHTALRWRAALFWLAYPIGYLGFALIRGILIDAGMAAVGRAHYPYGFINVDRLGYQGVALNTVLYGVAFWLLGVGLIALNHLLARHGAVPQGEPPREAAG
jgi:hypothetical protein